MRTHTSDFKNAIKTMGRQVYATITYGNTTLTNDDIKSINYNVNGDILKSVMRELTIESITNIPLKTQISLNIGLLVGNSIEYINYGNFIVETSEKQEDTNSYLLTCYDKMLYAQKPYESLGVAYPITIRSYISAICTKLGLTFANASSTFANYNKQIPVELYLDSEGNSLDYTFRDVLDELAQVTASTVCINDNDELEIRYLNDTQDTIDEEFLKDVNVNMGESFGAINTIVFSRSAGSDKIALSQPVDLPDEDKIALEIADNQILNGLDRGDYLADILTQLYGLTYYLNDFDSTGILYYDICDKYNITIGNNTYPCVMLNDEINVAQGIKETIFTELPQTSDTEYQYTNTQERFNSRTTLIVNKQGQQIQSVVSQIGDRTNKTTTITQDIDTIESQVQNMPVITTENSGIGQIQLQDLASVKLAGFRVHPTNQDILGLLISDDLIISDELIIDNREIVFSKTNFETQFDLPMLYYYNSDVYDEFVYDAVEERAYKIQRVSVDNLGNKTILNTPIEIDYEYKDIELEEGNYNIYVATCPTAYIYAKGMLKNEYTQTFATSYEENSKRTQLANQIYDVVREKVDKNEVIASLNIAVEDEQGVVELKGNSVIIESDNFELDRYGNAIFKGADIYLGDGSKIFGDDGLMSTILVNSSIRSQMFFGGNGLMPCGFSLVANGQIQQDYLALEFDIPSDFVITGAKIILSHAPISYTTSSPTTGYTRNLKLFKSSDNKPRGLTFDNQYVYFVNDDTNYSEIVGAFGENGFSGSSFQGTQTTSSELKDYITTGYNTFKIQSTATTPSQSQIQSYTGACMATLYITGFTKFEEPTTPTQSLLGGGLLGGNQNNEEPLNVGEPMNTNIEEESDI